MDKNIIKQHLTERFLSEAKDEASTPGINVTKAVTKKSGEVNKAGVKAIAKDVTSYEKNVKSDKDSGKMATNKFNYNGDKEKQYHDKMEIENGTEMNEYDREPNPTYKARAKEALEGSSRMGNKGGKDMGNAEASQGASSDDFGKTKLKNAEDSAEERAKATDNLLSFGDVIIPNPNPSKAMRKHSVYTNEGLDADSRNIAANNPYGTEAQHKFNNSDEAKESNLQAFIQKYGAVKTANALIKKEMKQLGLDTKNNPLVLNNSIFINGAENISMMISDGNLMGAEQEAGAIASEIYNNIDESKNNNKPQIKESMKRLKFKKEFNGVGNALNMIPESYRTDNKQFEMTDGNETYTIRWEGTLSEGRAVVLTAADKKMVNEDMQKMKHLWGYKSQETLGLVKGNDRLNENAVFSNIWNKSKALLEGDDIEDQDATEGDLDKAVKHAPEAKKHVEGSVSTEKGTKAPAPKKGNLEDIKKSAPEATKHVEGSVSTDKGTKAPAPKKGNWEDANGTQAAEAKKHIKMNESFNDDETEETEEDGTEEAEEVTTEATETVPTEKGTNAVSTKKGHWEDINVPHAAEAKKHIHMGEGLTLNGKVFTPINESEEDEEEEDYGTHINGTKLEKPDPIVENEDEDEEEGNDDWNKSDDEDGDVDAEPADTEISNEIPSDDDEDEVKVPAAPKASGARLMVSKSTGDYYIIGAGPSPILVPVEDKERAKMNPAKYAEEMSGEDDEMDESYSEDGMGDEVNMVNKLKKKVNRLEAELAQCGNTGM